MNSNRTERSFYEYTSTLCVQRQDKRVDCILPQRGTISGQITVCKMARYYGIATNEVLKPKYTFLYLLIKYWKDDMEAIYKK